MDIILSIKPKYAYLILSGEKTIEVRKVFPKKEIERIYLYSSSPVQKVVGYIDRYDRIITMATEIIYIANEY